MTRRDPPGGTEDRAPHAADALETLPAPEATPSPSAIAGDGPPLATSRQRYDVAAEIGRGGLGRVLEARDRHLGRVVAIKELQRHRDGDVARFLREALITARLQHPGIVPVYDAARWPDGAPFYAMKRVSGRSLDELIRERPSLDERLALVPNVLAVAETIAYAHSQRVIHRDLKPANVLIGEFGETVVIDWGLAKELGAPDDAAGPGPGPASGEHTVAGSVMGTPAYMAPEQARGEAADERADVYAIGAMLYAVLGGTSPFGDRSADELLAMVAASAPPPLETRAPGIPPDLAAIVRKAMARDPAARYATARELADDLRRFHTGQLVSARRYSRATLLRRWLRRHRAAVTTAALLLAALAVTAAASVRRVVQERNVAERERAAAHAARRDAERRAHAMLLEHARAALARDPTAAIRMLQGYPAAGEDWGTVRALAEAAQARGPARHVLEGHDERVSEIVLVDTDAAVTASWDGRLVAWDLARGTARVVARHPGEIVAMAISPAGDRIATATHREVAVWDRDGARRAWISGRVATAVAFTPDGGTVAFARDGELVIVDAGSGAHRTVAGPRGMSAELTWVDDAIVAAAADEVWVVDTRDGAAHPLCRPGEAAVASPVPNAAAATLVACADARGVVVFDAATRRARVELAGTTVVALAMSDDGALLAAADVGGWIRVVPLAGGEARLLRAGEPSHTLAFAPGGRHLAALGRDGADLVEVDTGLARPLVTHPQVSAIAFSPDGARVAIATHDGHARVFDTERPDPVILAADDRIVGVAATPSGRWIAAVTTGGDLHLHDRRDAARRVVTVTERASAAAVAPHADVVAVGAHDGAVHLVAIPDGPTARLTGHAARASSVAFAPGGDWLVSTSYDGTVRRWDPATGRGEVVLRHEGIIATATVSPDGRAIASGGVDRVVRLLEPGGAIRELGGHDHTVRALAFDPSGARLVSGSEDGTIRVWDLGDGGARVLEGHRRYVLDLALSPDARTLASVSNDGTVRLWDLASGEARVVRAPTEMSVVWSPSGDRLAVTGDGPGLAIDVATGEHRALLDQRSSTAAFTPDGRIVVASAAGHVHLGPPRLPADPAALRRWLADATRVHHAPP